MYQMHSASSLINMYLTQQINNNEVTPTNMERLRWEAEMIREEMIRDGNR